MPKAKPISHEMVRRAMRHTKSNAAAARYLNCSYVHYKRYAKLYESETHDNLFEEHKNPSGKGIPKFLRIGGKEPALLDIIEGRANIASFSPDRIKHRLLTEGYLEEKCAVCDFQERRVLDYKMPLLIHFKDSNKKNWKLDNLEMLCYNHYFLSVGDIFNDKQIEQLSVSRPLNHGKSDWEGDDYHLERLKELGLDGDIDGGEDELDIISRL